MCDDLKAIIKRQETILTEELREKTGRDDLVVEYDIAPLLRTEKQPRWPDDFRGFHTNVRPRRQK
jgi:hypothetical protein